jgi:molybdopterin-guanine dinucleotide biosynthesis adapter protein
MIPIISIVGYSNSGKTTLIERIIPKLKEKGYKVGTIKHDAHHFDIDHKGKDTWRMSAAGADAVAISSKGKMAFIEVLDEEKNIDELAQWLFKDVDIIITEGYKAFDKPKIEVIRNSVPITPIENNLIALVDSTPRDYSFLLPGAYEKLCRFDIENIESIIKFIEQRFLNKEMQVI